MKLKVTLNDTMSDVDISAANGSASASIDGREISFDYSQPEPNVYLVRDGNEIREFYVAPDGQTLSVRGRDFAVEVIDPKNATVGGAGSGSTDGVVEIKTAMPGKVVKLVAAVGATIESGDPVIVVEAMKMQNEMRSPKSGVVREIRFAEGDTVAAGDVLAVIE